MKENCMNVGNELSYTVQQKKIINLEQLLHRMQHLHRQQIKCKLLEILSKNIMRTLIERSLKMWFSFNFCGSSL